MVLRGFGRKTGRRYGIPVVAHGLCGGLYALTGARWRTNFGDGADVEVSVDGHVIRPRCLCLMGERWPGLTRTAACSKR